MEVTTDQPTKLEKATPYVVKPKKTKQVIKAKPITDNDPPQNKKNDNAAK